MESSFLALNVQFGGFFQNFGRVFKIKVKSSNIGHLDLWKLQSGEIIIETECVRFAKYRRIFQTFWKIFCKINIKVMKI